MSTLKVTNIQATGETSTRAVSGVAAAWVNFNGTGTIAVRDSVNIASLTDNGAGNYQINLTSSMGNTVYNAMCTKQDEVVNTHSNAFDAFFARSTGSYRFISVEAASLSDAGNLNSNLFGDLA